MICMMPIATLLLVLDGQPACGAPQAFATEIVIRAADISQADLYGAWTLACDETAASGIKVSSWDTIAAADGTVRGVRARGAPLAAPRDYFDVAFPAAADTPYRIWLRLRAPDGSEAADSVWVQFSDARVEGRTAYQIGTASGLLISLRACADCAASGWGWQDSSSLYRQPGTVTFATTGLHTLRVQVRAQGVQIDQIVLSADRYLNGPPGFGQDAVK